MTINFFENEVTNIRQRFNRTFGRLKFCDLRLRQAVIVSICLMERLAERINETTNTKNPQNKIRKFMRIRNALNKIFEQVENHQLKERAYCSPDTGYTKAEIKEAFF